MSKKRSKEPIILAIMAVVISLVTVIIPDLIIYNDMDVGHLIFSFVIISIALNMIFFYINRKILKLYPKVDSKKKTKNYI
ncbi:hypothetical protein [Dethiothermospora halolimnae]|uniref:hypothetical protein n=1 Tax=Dethiothermospora halolimnae TaxID=3114390 RepID=UPI003CCBAA88